MVNEKKFQNIVWGITTFLVLGLIIWTIMVGDETKMPPPQPSSQSNSSPIIPIPLDFPPPQK